MKLGTGILLTLLALSPFAAADNSVPLHASSVSALAGYIPHLSSPSADLLTGGQPREEAWEILKAEGVTTVINLRSEAEMKNSQEEEQVKAAGMNYIHIPVAGAKDINTANAKLLHEAMETSKGRILVHCGSGNRAGALLTIDAVKNHGMLADAAVSYGQSAGMTSLEKRVQEVLTNP